MVGQAALRRAAQALPQGPDAPDALLNIAEIHFDAGQVEQALQAYGKFVATHRDSPVFGYAAYKLGWCHFNLNDHAAAMREFIKVIEHANRAAGGRNRVTLKKEAERDLVRAYAHMKDARPDRALRFFRKVSPEDYLGLVEKLARVYSDSGEFAHSTLPYRQLIGLSGDGYAAVGWQQRITDNARAIGDQRQAVKEFSRLLTLWRSTRSAPGADPERVAADGRAIEAQLHRWAVGYFRQASETESEEDWALTHHLYASYLEAFPEGANAYEMYFFAAELRYRSDEWGAAAKLFDAVLRRQPDGPHTEAAAEGAVLSYRKVLFSKSVERSDNETLGAAIAPQPLTEDHARFVSACQRYKGFVDDPARRIEIEYDIAFVNFEFNHFDRAAPVFRDIAENHSTHRLAVFAANLVLDIHVLKNDQAALIAQADRLLLAFPEGHDAELRRRLERVKFAQCSSIESESPGAEAAGCYLRYAVHFRTSTLPRRGALQRGAQSGPGQAF